MSPIVDDPASARPLPRAVDVLRQLADRWGVVAVVSGRPAAFLAEQLPGAGATRLVGLYGLEEAGVRTGEVITHPEAAGWEAAIEEAAGAADRELPEGGAVERKGLTVTLHYRAVPDQGEQVDLLARRLGAELGLRVHPGKKSVELRPPVDVDKGSVVRQLATGLDAVAFAGDDTGDLPAFAALATLRGEGVTTLAIAADGPETRSVVVAAADVAVAGPEGVLALLADLATG
jgi:trehalose 6-phosphate phosphatase